MRTGKNQLMRALQNDYQINTETRLRGSLTLETSMGMYWVWSYPGGNVTVWNENPDAWPERADA